MYRKGRGCVPVEVPVQTQAARGTWPKAHCLITWIGGNGWVREGHAQTDECLKRTTVTAESWIQHVLDVTWNQYECSYFFCYFSHWFSPAVWHICSSWPLHHSGPNFKFCSVVIGKCFSWLLNSLESNELPFVWTEEKLEKEHVPPSLPHCVDGGGPWQPSQHQVACWELTSVFPGLCCLQ